MKYEEVKDLSLKDLVKKKNGLRIEMATAKMKNSLGQVSNPLSIRGMRKDLARIEMALTHKKNVK